MVASTLLAQLDLSGTAFGGTFNPTDVTRFVRLVDGVTITSWRQDVMSQIAPSTLNLTFDNDTLTGDATAPNAGRFTPGLSTSPWTGKILPGVRLRVTETVSGSTYQLFDGYALDWTAQPGGDDGTFPVVVTNFTDALGWMGTLQPLRSIVLEEMLLDAPSALYPLYEAAGAVSFGDITGAVSAGIATASKYGAGVVSAGADIGGTVTLPGTATTFANGTTLTGLQSVIALPSSAQSGSTPLTYECWIRTTSTTVAGHFATLFAAYNNALAIQFQMAVDLASNEVNFGGPGFSPVTQLNDGNWHHLVGVDSGASRTVYVDGVACSFVGASSLFTRVLSGVWLGGQLNYVTAFYPYSGDMAAAAIYPTALSATRVLAHYNAGKTAFAGERTDLRAARLLSYRPNTGSALDVGRGTVGIQDTNGVSLADALFAVGKAEGGLVYADGQGRITMLSRAHLYDPVAAATFDAEADLSSDYTARIDTQLLVNDETVSRPGGADQRAVDATSKSTYGWRQQSETYIVNSDRDADDAAGWLVVNQKAASVRTPSITFDITTMTSTTQAQAAMARQPLDRVALSNLPAWAPPTDVVVQGRTLRIDDAGLSVAFFTSPVARKTLRADAAPSANTKLDAGLVIPR